MVAACLEKDPARRPSTEELLDWFSTRAEGEREPGGEQGAASAAPGHRGVRASAGTPLAASHQPYPPSPYPPLPYVPSRAQSAPLTPPAYGRPHPPRPLSPPGPRTRPR